MKTIVCIINLFDQHQTISLYNGNLLDRVIGYVTLEKMSAFLALSCEEYSCQNIHFFGDQAFLEKIAKNTREDFSQIYNKNNIKIEVN